MKESGHFCFFQKSVVELLYASFSVISKLSFKAFGGFAYFRRCKFVENTDLTFSFAPFKIYIIRIIVFGKHGNTARFGARCSFCVLQKIAMVLKNILILS